MAAITERHLFGWLKEQELQSRLEDCLGKITKTSQRFDKVDFVNEEGWKIELKARRAVAENGKEQSEERFDRWLMPECKKGDGVILFFYFWEKSGKLWFCQYDEEEFEDVECSVPWFHTQKHFWIPRERWTEITTGTQLVLQTLE